MQFYKTKIPFYWTKTKISNNDKPESFAYDEDAERVECGLKMSILMPGIVSSYFTQPATMVQHCIMWFYETNQ